MKKYIILIMISFIFGQAKTQENRPLFLLSETKESEIKAITNFTDSFDDEQEDKKIELSQRQDQQKPKQKTSKPSKTELARQRRKKFFYLACIATGTIIGGILITRWYFKKANINPEEIPFDTADPRQLTLQGLMQQCNMNTQQLSEEMQLPVEDINQNLQTPIADFAQAKDTTVKKLFHIDANYSTLDQKLNTLNYKYEPITLSNAIPFFGPYIEGLLRLPIHLTQYGCSKTKHGLSRLNNFFYPVTQHLFLPGDR